MRKLLLSSAAVMSLASAAGAETIVVSATRTPEPAAVTGASISVISASDLEARQTVILSDALATAPGVTVIRNGGVGQTTSVLLRGAEVGQSVVLVDGVRINDPSAPTGQALMGDVLANGLERVEVLRGPQSTLYGSDAIGGVISLVTARGGENKATLTAEAGSLDTVHVNAAARGSYSTLDFGAAANFYTTNSVSAADSRNGNSEADGYHHFGATGNLRWHATEEVSVDARVYYTRARDSFDGFPPPNYTLADTHQYGTNELLALYGGVNGDFLNGRFTNRLSISRSDSDRKTFDTVQDFYGKGGTTSIEYQGGYKLNQTDVVTFGYEHERTSFAQKGQYDAAAIGGAVRVDGVYGQLQVSPLSNLTVTVGTRYSHNSQFGDHTSYKANVAYQLAEGTTLRANIGDGFKAPALYQLYSPYSNPVTQLKPELATGWEAGIDQAVGGWVVSATYFSRATTNQIDFFSCWGVTSTACSLRANEGGYYYNVARSLAKGIEVEASGEIVEGLKASLSYTNLTNLNQITRLQLARRPHDSVSGTLTWQALSDLSLGTSLTYVGSRFDDAGHFTKLKDRAELGFFANYSLAKGLELFGRVENVTDNRDELTGGYGTIGRTFTAGIRAKI
ncbi:vitamin B12 transporter [Rhizomicrobium palustre]|uniref:Vitamin B12 transporter n=1 Tax=Rhizomicrobium palustre TaxID=189966 RepID=A0A846N001_9PROT|nr:TonB-dependent receptor [Rhizomicrobium palustre]NIK89016.1 vitamin B12 transporter [Rhizomicrobium palustre]